MTSSRSTFQIALCSSMKRGVTRTSLTSRGPPGSGTTCTRMSGLPFGLSTPCAKLLVGETPPLLLAGLLLAVPVSLLFSLAGQCLMAAANELIMVFIGLEISSIASYILAGYLRDDKRNNESSLKYFLLGSFATAFLLADFLRVCRDDPRLCFELLVDISATDPARTSTELWINVSLLSIAADGFFPASDRAGACVRIVRGLAGHPEPAVWIPATLALTLTVFYLYGYTLNRITLFALIFSIGILVDDAIVVVENIYRHMVRGDRTPEVAAIEGVDEVGNPTVLATFTVIAAIMPLAFVG